MTENEVLEWIKRMRWQQLRHGVKPTKITMSRKNFNEMASGLRELVCIDAGDHTEYTVCGMEIEIRDDVDQNTLFIIT